jgi:hypothetical protein
MAFTATISISNAGTNATTFSLYSDVDSYVTPFETSISKAALLAGITSTNVPDGTVICRVVANCGTYVDMPIDDPYIYVYTRCDTGDPYYNVGVTTLVTVEDTNTPTPNCYQYADEGLLSAMTITYPSLTNNPTLFVSLCPCN